MNCVASDSGLQVLQVLQAAAHGIDVHRAEIVHALEAPRPGPQIAAFAGEREVILQRERRRRMVGRVLAVAVCGTLADEHRFRDAQVTRTCRPISAVSRRGCRMSG